MSFPEVAPGTALREAAQASTKAYRVGADALGKCGEVVARRAFRAGYARVLDTPSRGEGNEDFL